MSTRLRVGILLLSAVFALPAAAAERLQTAAPYFEARADGERVETLPLASSSVEVVIGGIIADVRLSQQYENRGDRPVEAVYVFPASSRATVYAVTMKVGNRVIRAKLRERGAARKEYEQAQSEGRTATLLEQQDVGAFRMNVANVLPGDRIEVQLHYVEMLVPTKGVYEFFFPNTAPVAKYAPGRAEDLAMPSSGAAAVVEHALGMRLRLLSGAPIASIESPSHPILVQRAGAGEATVLVDPKDARAAARDFVLRYSMLGDDVGTGVLAYEGADENFFLLTAQPPRVVLPESVPPREYIFIVDVSGSMTGRPLDVSKTLLGDLFGTLRPDDRLNVILFAGGSLVMSDSGSLPATPETLERALATMRGTDAGGGTELAQALEVAYALPATPGMARSLVIITDGGISPGESARMIASRVDQANAFVFGVGDYLNHAVIENLARAGQGEPFLVEKMSGAEAEAARLREYIDRPVLTQARLSWAGADLYDLQPAKLPDLFAQRPIVVVGKYRGPLVGRVQIAGYSGRQPVTLAVDLAQAYRDPALSSLPLLWARRRIDWLQDNAGCLPYCGGDEALKKDVVAVGLKYGVLTPHTSFVAVTEEVRTNEAGETVVQPVAARDGAEGYGFDAAAAAQVLAAVRLPVPRAVATAPEIRLLAGHRMASGPDGWRDLGHRDDARLLRIRRDSDAFRMLLRLRPDLAPVLALPGRVLVSLGGWSVQITPDGFGDYPEAQLRAIAGAR